MHWTLVWIGYLLTWGTIPHILLRNKPPASTLAWIWAVILFPIAAFALALLGDGHIGDVVSKAPGTLVKWAPGVAYTVLVGYGLATVIGKQVE